IATYNIRIMRREEHLISLERELRNIKWDIMGVSETRLPGEETTLLKSGHLLFQKNAEESHLGGVALLIHKEIKHLVTKLKAVSDRVAYVLLRLNQRYILQIIQAYAPTSTAQDEDIERFYEDLIEARSTEKAHFTIMMGDFNAKIGRQTMADTNIGMFGLGTRNNRGQTLIDFLGREGMYCMNTFFQEKPQKKWTWRSPDGTVKNEIDYILSSNKNICTDVSVLNRFDTGSDHRLV
ncbi:Craniofacial development protein 2, partial [Camponotus floridanus]